MSGAGCYGCAHRQKPINQCCPHKLPCKHLDSLLITLVRQHQRMMFVRQPSGRELADGSQNTPWGSSLCWACPKCPYWCLTDGCASQSSGGSVLVAHTLRPANTDLSRPLSSGRDYIEYLAGQFDGSNKGSLVASWVKCTSNSSL